MCFRKQLCVQSQTPATGFSTSISVYPSPEGRGRMERLERANSLTGPLSIKKREPLTPAVMLFWNLESYAVSKISGHHSLAVFTAYHRVQAPVLSMDHSAWVWTSTIGVIQTGDVTSFVVVYLVPRWNQSKCGSCFSKTLTDWSVFLEILKMPLVFQRTWDSDTSWW